MKFAFKASFPILLGYLAIGSAYGLIVQNAGYPWYVVLITGLLIYAGAGQYALIPLCVAMAGYTTIAVATLLINARHMFYGISLIEKYKNTMPYTPYLIFGLTDETYGVVTTTKIPPELDKKKIYLYITALNHFYWVGGGIVGYFAGALIPFDFAGVDFALTALFVVLLIEQWKNSTRKLPFLIALIAALTAQIVMPASHMLIAAFILSVIILILFRKKLENV